MEKVMLTAEEVKATGLYRNWFETTVGGIDYMVDSNTEDFIENCVGQTCGYAQRAFPVNCKVDAETKEAIITKDGFLYDYIGWLASPEYLNSEDDWETENRYDWGNSIYFPDRVDANELFNAREYTPGYDPEEDEEQ